MRSKTITAKPGTYANGIEMVERIVSAAEWVLVEKGHSSLTLKRVAERAKLKLGNIYYYFPTKQVLIGAVLESLFASSKPLMDQIDSEDGTDPQSKLIKILSIWIEGNQSRRTSRLYTELWAMANHDPAVRLQLDKYYDAGIDKIRPIIRAINPSLDNQHVNAIIVHIVSVLEGLIIFVGDERRILAPTDLVVSSVVKSIIQTISFRNM